MDEAKHGKINSDLLSNDQLLETIKVLSQTDPTAIIPVSGDNPDLGALSRMSNVHLMHVDGKLVVIIEISLTRNPAMKLYRMIPCKVPQLMARNATGAAFIQPETKYLAVSLNNQHYFKASSEYIQNCIAMPEYYLCAIHVLKSVESSSCEVELLLNPSLEAMKTCDIKILKQHQTQWTWLEESQSWLFSTARIINLNVVCGETRGVTLKLKDTLKG